MLVTHRYGEPENAAAPLTVSGSLLGLPTDKGALLLILNIIKLNFVFLTHQLKYLALVSEDHLLEIAGYREMHKDNKSYDSMHLPRYAPFFVDFKRVWRNCIKT